MSLTDSSKKFISLSTGGLLELWPMELRLAEAQSRLTLVQKDLSGGSKRMEGHLQAAEEHLAAAKGCFSQLMTQSSELQKPELRAIFFDAILRAAVELDTISHLDVDPNEGWVTFEWIKKTEGSEYGLIDTQLLRLFLMADRGGEIVGFDYKPQKLNLSDRALSERFGVLDKETKKIRFLTTAEGLKTKVFPTKETKGLLSVRFEQTASVPELTGKFLRDLTIKSGIGAHLTNSTTGFSIEFWLEELQWNAQDELLFIQTWNIALPTFSPELLVARPLLCVGGVADAEFDLSREIWTENSDYPGGLHGVRLIDSVKTFVMDLRTARPISGFRLIPITLSETSLFQGLQLQMVFSAKQLIGDDKSNTVFVSIM